MIKAFRLHNFKAFEDSGLIELKPITVLAGANSGGKSSILQSLLLLKQTLEAPPDIELSLDGKFLQYSSFSDVVYGKPTLSSAQLTFSFYLENHVNLNRWARFFPGVTYLENERGDVDSHVSLSFGFRRQTGERSIGRAALQRFEVSSAIQGFDGPSLTGTWVKSGSRVTIAERGVQRPREFRNRRIVDITGQHFLPNALVFQPDEEEQGSRPYLALHATFSAPLRDLQRELKDNLQYLGPLRERPQRAYLHSGNPMTEIGESGQYAAQILWLEKDKPVDYVASIGSFEQRLSLLEAVNDAFVKMGLQQAMDVRSERGLVYQLLFGGKAGGGGARVTIADVGFGLSQLLPVVVLGLRSSPSSLMMLEQPEIHLHPRLQANLADFLLGLASQGKRVMVETHSDHFLNRLRRRIAEDPTDSLADMVNILFVHGASEVGGASIDPLRIDRFGVIENWPPDFLPEASDEVEAIVLAGLNKRRGGGS